VSSTRHIITCLHSVLQSVISTLSTRHATLGLSSSTRLSQLSPSDNVITCLYSVLQSVTCLNSLLQQTCYNRHLLCPILSCLDSPPPDTLQHASTLSSTRLSQLSSIRQCYNMPPHCPLVSCLNSLLHQTHYNRPPLCPWSVVSTLSSTRHATTVLHSGPRN
jgi:hypothetical protein